MRGGGAVGAGGYRFQAQVTASFFARVLAAETLPGLPVALGHPVAVSAETGGSGDDVRVEVSGYRWVEVQVKRGLQVGSDLWSALDRIIEGLVGDTSLYCLLVIDERASRTVRGLEADRERLANGLSEPLSELGRQWLGTMTERGVAAAPLLRRLRIQSLDFSPGLGALSEATGQLRGLVDPPDRAEAAWAHLVEEASAIIRDRSRRDRPALVEALVNAGIPLSPVRPNPAAALAVYRDQVRQASETFALPGLGVSHRTRDAWERLQLIGDTRPLARPGVDIAEWVRHYRESGFEIARGEGAVSAEHAMQLWNRLVVLGRAGSGKSTLLCRMALEASSAGQDVLWVRLRLVAERLDAGWTFDRALLGGAVVHISDAADDACAALLEGRTVILADGLDECGAGRAEVASQLCAWGLAHPTQTLVVSSRPSSHDASLLPGWHHAEILPLDEPASLALADRVLSSLEVAASERSDAIARLEELIRARPAAREAAAVPMFVGVLAVVTHRGESLDSRASVLEALVRVSETHARGRRPRETLSVPFRSRVLASAALILTEQSVSTFEGLVDRLVSDLGVEGELEQSDRIAAALESWEGRGILERIAWADREAVLFTHQAVCELQAAKRLSSVCESQRMEWVRGSVANLGREEILVYLGSMGHAQPVVDEILRATDVLDPRSTSVLLAARVAAEAGAGIDVASLFDGLAARLGSTIPEVAYEVATAAISLASRHPSAVERAFMPSLESAFTWSRHSALAICLSAELPIDPERVRAEVLAMIDSRGAGIALRGGVRQEVEEVLLIRGGDRVLSALGGERKEAFGRRLLEHVSVREAVRLFAMLRARGLGRLEAERFGDLLDARVFEALRGTPEGGEDPEVALVKAIESVAAACDPGSNEPHRDPVLALALVVAVLDVGDKPIQDLVVLAEDVDSEEVRLALRCALEASGSAPCCVVRGAQRVRAQLLEMELPSLLSVLPAIPPTADWSWCRSTDVNADTLAKALVHPSSIVAQVALKAIEAGVRPEGLDARVLAELPAAGRTGLFHVARSASAIWDGAAGEILRQAVRPGRDGAQFLLAAAWELGAFDDRDLDLLFDCLDGDGEASCMAARLLQDLDELELARHAQRLLASFTERIARGETCRRHGPFLGWSCPECRVIPPSPIRILVGLLHRSRAWSDEELIRAMSHQRSDVADGAFEQLTTAARERPELAREMLAAARSGACPARFVGRLATEAALFRAIRESLEGLAGEEDPDVRLETLRVLIANLSGSEIEDRLQGALEDADPRIRDLALRGLRGVAPGGPRLTL